MNAARTLAGRRILLTRSEEDSAAWADALERHGITPIVLPCITAEPIDSPELASALTAAAAGAGWLVFTSRRGVEGFVRLTGRGSGRDAHIAVVGPATADAARRLLGRVDLVGDDGTAVGLARVLRERLGSGPAAPGVVLVLAENARDTLQKRLTEAGIGWRRFDVYRTVPAPRTAARRRLASFGVDTVFLASPSAVTGFVNQVEPDGSARLVTIGPSTSEAVRSAGLDVAAEAREPSLAALLEAMP